MKPNALFSCSLVLVLLFTGGSTLAQSRQSPFEAGFVSGINFSQLDGDNFFGYKQKGFIGGVRGSASLGPRFYLGVEFLFSQQGANSTRGNGLLGRAGRRNATFQSRINFLEAPLIAGIRFKPVKEDRKITYFQWEWQAGASYTQLVYNDSYYKNDIGIFSIDGVIPQFQNRGVHVFTGLKRNINNHFSVGFRHTTAVYQFFNDPESQLFGDDITFLRSYYVSVLGYYTF